MESDIEFINAKGWFKRGHDISGGVKNVDGVWIPTYQPASFVWSPPPAVATIATEELRQARQKRQLSAHVVVVPRLMWVEWWKQILKSADLIFDVPAGCKIWEKNMHEPLIFALYFPYLSTQEVAIAGGFGKALAPSVQNGLPFGRVSSVTILLPLAKDGLNAASRVAQSASKQARRCPFLSTEP